MNILCKQEVKCPSLLTISLPDLISQQSVLGSMSCPGPYLFFQLVECVPRLQEALGVIFSTE